VVPVAEHPSAAPQRLVQPPGHPDLDPQHQSRERLAVVRLADQMHVVRLDREVGDPPILTVRLPDRVDHDHEQLTPQRRQPRRQPQRHVERLVTAHRGPHAVPHTAPRPRPPRAIPRPTVPEQAKRQLHVEDRTYTH
jgi:hypothetical protein